jgi:hypothetical protein
MFLAAAAAATPAPAPAATSGAGGGGAAPDASGSGGIDGSAPVSIFGRVVRRPEDMVPPAVRRVLTGESQEVEVEEPCCSPCSPTPCHALLYHLGKGVSVFLSSSPCSRSFHTFSCR